jgi:hypothetical protein
MSPKDWLAVIGVSSLIATALGHWLSKRREHERWAYENRKQEWRELIDQMQEIVHRMRNYHSRLRKDILEDINEGMRILTEILEEQRINKKWGELIGNTFGLDDSERVDDLEFLSRSIAFQNYLVSVAQDDLKLNRKKRTDLNTGCSTDIK